MSATLYTIEVRQAADAAPELRVRIEMGFNDATIQVNAGGSKSQRTIPVARVRQATDRLERTAIPLAPMKAALASSVGYELIISSALAQSSFRWVSTVPPGWEPIAEIAEELLALAGD
ncbi:MAG: hypothetical protein JWO05_2485 [Gemmatimonadetes bacterium]|nr:hypothetical protein [Gemmatimonadota bacterium]